MLEICPITREAAFAFIHQHHRHHTVPVGGLWWQAVHDADGLLRGVCIVGRPVAREFDDGLTVEVTRLCTDGAPNACSMLYSAARRVAKDKGYRRGLTYILDSEDGSSLRAAGWALLGVVKGRSWSCPSRPRTDKHPTCDKQRFGWGAWPQLNGINGLTVGGGGATLHCKKCHADRAKEGCRNQYRDCPFTGTAQPTKDTP